MRRVGLISDTHGHLDERVEEIFAGVDAIVHAGDIGGEEILYALQAIAPVTAVRGNVDHQGPTWSLPDSASLTVGGVRIHVTHDRASVSHLLDGAADVLVFGHTHKREVKRGAQLLEVNPGSASRPLDEDGLRTVAVLEIDDDRLDVRTEAL